jgi:uncharacterized protein YgbK (DUF1537 family)
MIRRYLSNIVMLYHQAGPIALRSVRRRLNEAEALPRLSGALAPLARALRDRTVKRALRAGFTRRAYN